MHATLIDVLEHGAAGDPALVVPGGPRLTYGQLREQVSLTAERLSRLGFQRADRLALVYPNGAEAIVLFLAVAAVATAAPLNPAYREEEFRMYLEDIDARAVLVPPGGGEAVRAALPPGVPLLEAHFDGHGQLVLTGEGAGAGGGASAPQADDVALVLPTSGTTGRPKQVPLRHRNLAASIENIAATYRLGAEDVALCVMPLFHSHGLMASTMATLRSGGTVVIPRRFDPLTFWPLAQEHGMSWYSAVPTIHQMLLMRHRGGRPAGANNLRFIRSSSSALSPETMKRLEETFGAPVLEAYGMTEASHQVASNPLPPGQRKAGSVGMGTGVQIGIMDGAEELLAPGAQGEVVIRGPNVMDGYANNPDANLSSFSSGWFRTGDQGVLDADGYLALVGRRSFPGSLAGGG